MTYPEFEERYQYDSQRDFLARGGFGAVYKAYDTVRKRYVAIKESDVDPSHKFSLLREVELSHEIEPHDNVVRYINSYRFTLGRKDTDYAVMPYFKQGNLNQVLAQHALNNDDRLAIAQGLLQGVAHLHRQGVIHRDLKASNILMELRDGQWIPKLTDFGVSKLTDTGVSVSNTQIGLSVQYAAPEQLRNETILPNVDLWAVGVSLYKVVMGKLPFDPTQGQTDAPTPGREFDTSAVAALINRGLTPEQAAPIPYPFRAIIEKCLIVDKHQRAKTADELMALLAKPKPEPVPALPLVPPSLPLWDRPARPDAADERPTSLQAFSTPESAVESIAQTRLSVRRLTTNERGITVMLTLAGAAHFPLQLSGAFATPEGILAGSIRGQAVHQNGEIQIEADYPPALGVGQVQFRLNLTPVNSGTTPEAFHLLVETDWYDWQRPQQQIPMLPPNESVQKADDDTGPTIKPQRGQVIAESIRSRLWIVALITVVVVAAASYYLTHTVTNSEPAPVQPVTAAQGVTEKKADNTITAAEPYVNGIALVTSPDGRKRYRTIQGQMFDEIRTARCGRIPVRLGNLWGYLNLNGDLTINLYYDDAQAFDERTCNALVTANGDVYRVDRWGEKVKQP